MPSRNPAQVSFWLLEPVADAAMTYFYAQLFAMDTEIRAMFPAAMDVQRRRFFEALGRIAGAQQSQADRDHLVVSRGKRTLTVLNRFPYNNGHLLVAPLAHKANLEDLDEEELLEGMQVLQEMTRRIRETMSAEGFNIGVNLGKIAGAGLPGHLHWHLVPRWSGDTNFMPVLSNVNVIPQSLDALYELLAKTKI